MHYIISILFGLLPEVLYFTLFLIYTKNLKEHKIKLFILIAIAYFICLTIQRFYLLFYILFIFMIYLLLKFLYKEKVQIIDIFIIGISTIYLSFLSLIEMPFVKNNYFNYYILFIINRFLLFIPFVLKNKFNKYYKKYCKLWNRNDKEKRIIKSITLRNISLIIMNIFIFILNILTVYCINIFNK